MSCTVYTIKYSECLVLWCVNLQTNIALSKTEAEYIALIQAICKVISFMDFIKELSFIFDIHLSKPAVFCKIFKENKSCIAVTES